MKKIKMISFAVSSLLFLCMIYFIVKNISSPLSSSTFTKLVDIIACSMAAISVSILAFVRFCRGKLTNSIEYRWICTFFQVLSIILFLAHGVSLQMGGILHMDRETAEFARLYYLAVLRGLLPLPSNILFTKLTKLNSVK